MNASPKKIQSTVAKGKHGDQLRRNYDIIEATKNDDYELVKEILEDDPKEILTVDMHDMTALHWAAATGKIEIAELFFSSKHIKKIQEQKDGFGREPMQLALESGNERMRELFFKHVYPEFQDGGDPYPKKGQTVPLVEPKNE